jgi:hypothetical protein
MTSSAASSISGVTWRGVNGEASAPTVRSRDVSDSGICSPRAACVPALAMGSADAAVGHRLVRPMRRSRSTTGERHMLPVQTARIAAGSSLVIGVILGVSHASLSAASGVVHKPDAESRRRGMLPSCLPQRLTR